MDFLKQAQQAASQYGVSLPSGGKGNAGSNDNSNSSNNTATASGTNTADSASNQVSSSSSSGNKANNDNNQWQAVGSDGRAAYEDYTSGAHKGNLMGAFSGVAKQAGAALQAGGGKVADPKATLQDLYAGATGGAKKVAAAAAGAGSSATSAVLGGGESGGDKKVNADGHQVGDGAGKEGVQQGVDGTTSSLKDVSGAATITSQQVQEDGRVDSQELGA